MAEMVNRGKELIRISDKNRSQLQYSTSDGRTWYTRFSGSSSVGEFRDLTDNGKEILATTSKGLFYSVSDGRNWYKRN